MPAGESDESLLDAWRGGDVEAGQVLFSRHFESVHRFFANKVWDGEIDDLIQETFLGCVRGRDRVETSFRAYLFGAARMQLLKHIERSRRGRREDEYHSARVAGLDASPSQLALAEEEQQLLLRALRRLPIEHQILVELYYWEDMRSIEISEVLDIPHGTVRSRLRRARSLLATLVEEVASSPELARSTLGNFEGWVRSLQRQSPVGPPDSPDSPSS